LYLASEIAVNRCARDAFGNESRANKGREFGMKRKPLILVVLVMCPNAAEARKLARRAVEKRLAACGNVFTAGATSIYRWKGKIEQTNEVLLMLKTTRATFPALEFDLRAHHSYDVPEIIALPAAEALPLYETWVSKNVAPSAKRSGPRPVKN
jgi:periplasmic divalent cation tolerance protein